MNSFMKHLLFLLIPLFIIGFSSCKNDSEHQQTIQQEDDLSVKLNNGERWDADSTTTAGIQNMTVIVEDFIQTDSDEAYLTLNADLEGEFASIFRQCTMTGPGHDQLHNYLLPLKRYFNRLKSENNDERQKAVEDLKVYLADYKSYFE